MGERRVPSVLSQNTLADPPPPDPSTAPPDLPSDPSALPPPEASPRPILYPTVAPSSVALHERQLRWFRERDRRARSTADPPAQSET
jgi:hypothetical protein